ncbi:MAG TPA: glycosyltransferase [Candidatus Saccharimonadales bacterium]|nr:glycosyltransferase [Candidatus Saccharimonadales bacterium]
MKIAIVTCSPQNDYPRALSLRAAFKACSGVDLRIVRNRHRGWLRYPETMLRLAKTRFFDRPDAYVVTFRGYETLLFLRLSGVRRPIIFDELINFTEWMEEQGRLRPGTLPYRLFRRWYAWLVKRCRLILADTAAHAAYSAKLNMLSIERYRVVPVGIDETVFDESTPYNPDDTSFTVLYYGHMLPLHGLEYVLDAAVKLKANPAIKFRLVGGKKQGAVAKACARAAAAGANLSHESWLPFEALPAAIAEAGLTLGGPFGGTLQSRFVVTGKTYQVLACAAPVLIGANEVQAGFVDKQNCLIVPQADAEALAATIQWAAEHPKELKAIGKNGRALYEKHFSQAVVNSLAAAMVTELGDGAG